MIPSRSTVDEFSSTTSAASDKFEGRAVTSSRESLVYMALGSHSPTQYALSWVGHTTMRARKTAVDTVTRQCVEWEHARTKLAAARGGEAERARARMNTFERAVQLYCSIEVPEVLVLE